MKCEIHCNVRIRKLCFYPMAALVLLKIPVPKWMFAITTEVIEV